MNDIEEFNKLINKHFQYLEKEEEWDKLFFHEGYYGKNSSLDDYSCPEYELPVTFFYENEIKSLSKNMKQGLKEIILGKNEIPTRTLNALKKRNLLDDSKVLNDIGRVIAISFVSLEKQCELLGIEFEKIQNDKCNERPEICVLNFYENQKYNGFFTEGKVIFAIIQTIIMSVLYPLSEPYFKYEDSLRLKFKGLNLCVKFKENIYKEIYDAFENINNENFIHFFNLLKSIQKQTIFNTPPTSMDYGLSDDFIDYDSEKALMLFKVLGSDIIKNLFIKINNSELVYAGWTDLVIFNQKECCFVEVKKTDKLIPSQIITLLSLKSLNIKIKVNKLVS